MSAETGSLVVENLAVGYGDRLVIADVTLPPIEAGQVTALIGPNGAGKSTLLKALAQIVPSRGTLRFGGTDLRALPRRKRALMAGFMPQALPALSELTAMESVIIALQAGRGPARPERHAMAIFDRLDIVDLALRPLDRLSGGERQLVSLAQAIANEPPLLFLDEPTSALDLARQFQVMSQVRAIARAGTAIVVVLHDLGLAAQWADRLLVLEGGRLHSAGAPREALTASMLADVYGLSARVETFGERLVVVPEGLAAPRRAIR